MKIFIENDLLIDEWQLEQNRQLLKTDFVFDKVITNAYQNSVETLEAILEASEIYAETTFLGDGGKLMDDLAYHLRLSKIKGKKFFIFSTESDLNLWRIKRPFDLKYLLEDNEMFCLSANHGDNVKFVKFNSENLCS